MKAGLLQCDHVAPKYRAKFGDYPDMFAALFPELEWKLYDVVNGQFPESLDECDLYMTTGSRYSVYENLEWIVRLKEMIKAIYHQNKFFIGFCFGHQLIGEALGGKVEKSPNGWCVGVHDFEIGEEMGWMQSAQKTLSLLMMCQDQIVKLPTNAKILGSNEKCPIGIMQVGKRILGIQAHPEFPKEYDKLLMEQRVEKMGAAIVQNGITSLNKTIHPQLIHDWVMNFIKS